MNVCFQIFINANRSFSGAGRRELRQGCLGKPVRLGEGRWRKLLPVMGHLCTELPRRQLSIYPLPILLPNPPPRDAGDGTGYVPIARLGKQSKNLLREPDRARAAGDSPRNAVERTLGQEPETSVLSPALSLAVLAFLGLSLPISWVPAGQEGGEQG